MDRDQQAQNALRDALEALDRAIAASRLAEYGAVLMGELSESRDRLQFALSMAEGKV